MIIKSMRGDLIEAFKNNEFNAIIHGCNCFCSMGKGIAKQISEQFASALLADKTTMYGDKEKLGSYTHIETEYGILINAYTQYNYGYGKINCDYDAIKNVFTKINTDFEGMTIGIPSIGCGLAGGDWNIVTDIINEVTDNLNIIHYYL